MIKVCVRRRIDGDNWLAETLSLFHHDTDRGAWEELPEPIDCCFGGGGGGGYSGGGGGRIGDGSLNTGTRPRGVEGRSACTPSGQGRVEIELLGR